MTHPRETVEAIAEEYYALLLKMHSERIEQGGKPRTWNRLVNRMQAAHLKLRATAEGRDAITLLIDDENATVRSWSAVNALAWAEGPARAALEREAVAGGIAGFDAEISLREFDAGRLNTAWVPRLR